MSEHPLEYLVDGEWFKVDNAWLNTDRHGKQTMMYSKSMGTTRYSALSPRDLKAMCDAHQPVNNEGAQDWYGKGKFMGD